MSMMQFTHISHMYWSLVKWKYGKMREHLLDRHLEAYLSKYMFLFFLMNSNGNAKDEVPYHWTLLVLDNQYGEWRHYNSLRPRDNRKDLYSVDAREFVSYVESYIWNIKTEVQVLYANFILVQDAPQQCLASLDIFGCKTRKDPC